MTKIDRPTFPLTPCLLPLNRKLGVSSPCWSSNQDVRATPLQFSCSFFLAGQKIAVTVPGLASLFDAGRKEEDKGVRANWVDPILTGFPRIPIQQLLLMSHWLHCVT